MAGRGVDIVLGGKDGEDRDRVIKAGGLYVIGTERHEARRVDNQLRGRAGRQGDSGASRFYLSLEDDLMRVFGGEQISSIMDRLKLPEDQPIENGLISRAIEQAQIKVEGFHFDIRKRLVEFDDVANQQREIIYKLRRRILESNDFREEILGKLKVQITKTNNIADIIPFDDASLKAINKEIEVTENKEEFLEKVLTDIYEKREKDLGDSVMREVEKYAYLGSIDHLWMDHIDHIDDLREGVNLRGYGQRDPLVEFKNEAYTLFENLVDKIDEELGRRIFRIQVGQQRPEIPTNLMRENLDPADTTGVVEVKKKAKVGRNDPCPCGSGKKYKKCHFPQYG
jgi:preprotein translocase subunit SecA